MLEIRLLPARHASLLAELLRLVVTAAAVALPTLLQRVPLPGFEPPGALDVVPAMSLGGLGLDAVLIAFVLVELAAFVVPRWRSSRRDNRVQLLRVTFVLAALAVVVQALLVSWFLRGSEFFRPGLGPMLLDAATLTGGVLVLVGAARVVTRWGTGHGLSVVVVLGALPYWLERVDVTAMDDPEAGVRTLVLAALGALFLVGRKLRGVHLPIAGLVPLLLPAWLLQALLLLQWVLDLDLSWLFAGGVVMGAIVAGAVTIALVGWSARGRGWDAVKGVGPAVALSIAATSAIVVGDDALFVRGGIIAASTGLAFFVTAVVVLMDVLREASLRLRVELVPVLAFDDVVAADRAGERLAAADIAYVLRGVGHRTLLRFFGPWVPVRLFVEAGRADEAARIARAEAHREAHEDIVRFF